MRKLSLIALVLAILLLSGCGLFQAKINNDFKRDDLNPSVVDSISVFSNDAYKMDPRYTNDFFVALIRMNLLNVKMTKDYIVILFDILSIRNKDYIDVNWIMSHLDSKQQKDFNKTFPSGLPRYKNTEEVIRDNKYFADTVTCKPVEVDAHWTYFSATGDTKIIEKIEKSRHVYGTPCCFDCVEWSLPSRATENKEVYDKLTEIRDKNCAESQNPDFCISHYNQRLIPPKGQCEWAKKNNWTAW